MTDMKKIPLVVVCGPTACGKTALGVELALRLGGEVVSADSMQVYKGLDIGTAKPTAEERRGVPHHMIDVAEPWENYSVARYCAEAAPVIEDIARRGRLPIIVGGTGLYIDSLVANTDFSSPSGDEALRAELMREAEEKGNVYLHELLRRLDPQVAETIHPNNVKRVIRAIEQISLSGKSRAELDESSRRESPYHALRFAVEWDRAVLYERINARVDEMLEKGLVDEVRRVLIPALDRAGTAAQAIGYKEIVDCIEGRCSLDEAVETIKRNTRRYAKRQLTWLRRNGDINWLSPENAADAAEKIYKEEMPIIQGGNNNEIQH